MKNQTCLRERSAGVEGHIKAVGELHVRTGLIASEIAALKPGHIRGGYLHIESSIARELEKDELKNT